MESPRYKCFVLMLFAFTISLPSLNAQEKLYAPGYQQAMGKALDKMSHEEVQQVLRYAIRMTDQESARQALSAIARNLSKEQQTALLEYVQSDAIYRTSDLGLSVPERTTTSIEFDEESFDFGEIDQGEKVYHSYKFTNTGSEPLTIIKAKGSCGCTVPDWPKEDIEPGASAEIKVQFDSRGKKGKQNKRVTITTNTDPPNTYLIIKGFINEVDER